MPRLLSRCLCAALLTSAAWTARAETEHLYWRRLAITSQASQIGDLKYYLITGNVFAAEAITPPRVCWYRGLNAGIFGASLEEIGTAVSAVQPRPALVVVIGPLQLQLDEIPVIHIDGNQDLRRLSEEISQRVAASLGC